jgi:hypothetical protein
LEERGCKQPEQQKKSGRHRCDVFGRKANTCWRKEVVNNLNNKKVGLIAGMPLEERLRKQHTNKLAQAKQKTYKVLCG